MFSEIDAGVASLQQARTQLGVYRQALLKKAFTGKLTAKWRAENPDQIEPAEQLLERIRQEREVRYQQQLEDWKAAVQEWEESGEEGKKPAKPRKAKELEKPRADELPVGTNLPDSWSWVRVANLGILGTGITPLKSRSDFHEGGDVPWITSTVVNSEYVRRPNSYVTKVALKETNLRLYPKGSLIIALYGEGKTRGKASEISFDTTVNQALAVVTQEGLEKKTKPFLKQFLLKNYNDVRMLSSGGVQPNLNLSIVENTLLPLCSLPEQKEIVRLLEAQFEAIEQNEREIDTALARAEALRQSILKKAFSGQLVEQDPNDEPASVLLEHIRQEREAAASKKPKKKAAHSTSSGQAKKRLSSERFRTRRKEN